MAVIDKTGKPVTGLTQGDFTVLENGARQTVSTFASDAPAWDSPGAAAIGSADPTAVQNRRVFLILLGSGRTEGPVHHFEGVIRFLRERLLRDDLVSVMAFNRATPFTTDHEHIAQVVEHLKLSNNTIAFDLRESALRTRGKQDIPDSIQRDIDTAFETAVGSESGLRNVATMLLGVSLFRTNDGAWRPWNRMVASRDLLRLYAGIEYLRHLEGGKHLICLMETGLAPPPIRISGPAPVGLFLDSRDDDARLAARANDAHVALDIIHTSGEVALWQQFGIMSSKNVSELSGGQFTGVRTADVALTNIDAVTRAGYVLGYMPANPALDGKYRNIVVKVNRPGVTVLFPHGTRRGRTRRRSASGRS